jgi:hypothetical protein
LPSSQINEIIAYIFHYPALIQLKMYLEIGILQLTGALKMNLGCIESQKESFVSARKNTLQSNRGSTNAY